MKSVKEVLFDPDHHWAKSAEFAELAAQAHTECRREHFQRMSHTSELLAKNSEYLRSMDVLLKDLHGRSELVEKRIEDAATYPSRFSPQPRLS